MQHPSSLKRFGMVDEVSLKFTSPETKALVLRDHPTGIGCFWATLGQRALAREDVLSHLARSARRKAQAAFASLPCPRLSIRYQVVHQTTPADLVPANILEYRTFCAAAFQFAGR